MFDPLELLRQYTMKRQEIIESEEEILFDECSFPKNVQTNFLKHIHDEDKKAGVSPKYYTLDCLLYFLKNVKLQHKLYVQKCEDEDMPSVNRPDRNDLLAYLNGKIETCARIDTNKTPNKRSNDDNDCIECIVKKVKSRQK